MRVAELGDDTLCRAETLDAFWSPSPQRGRGVRGEGANTQLEVTQAFWEPRPEPRLGNRSGDAETGLADSPEELRTSVPLVQVEKYGSGTCWRAAYARDS